MKTQIRIKTRVLPTLFLLLLSQLVLAEGKAPFPVFQMRDAVPESNRLDTKVDGKKLFSNYCGYCHLEAGMGTNLLTRKQVLRGQPPHTGLLANRTDLNAAFIKAIVRSGIGSMPRITKVDVTDSELDQIANFLSSEHLSGETP